MASADAPDRPPKPRLTAGAIVQQDTYRELRQVDREPLRDGIRRHLVERILTGRLEPGDRIPLVETAEAIGVSMTPLRESLVQLEREGFVRCDPGRGYAVAELDPEEIRQLYPLIWTLEVLGLRSAPPDREALDELERLNGRFRAVEDPDEARRLDLEWHRTLLAGCENHLLLELLSLLKTRAARYELAYMRETGNIGFSARQHARVVELLRKEELERAAATLEENWRIGPKVLLPWLEARRARERDGGENGTRATGFGRRRAE